MAKLLRGTGKLALQRGGELTAAQRSGGTAEPVGAAARVYGGAWGGVGFLGCGLGRLRRRRGSWACVPRERRGEIPGGDRGLPLRARGEGKGMTLLSGSGQAVRRGGRSVGARRAGACVGACWAERGAGPSWAGGRVDRTV